MKIVVAGGSGSLGRALSADLVGRGHEVVVLTRSPGRGAGRGVREVAWDARTVGPWADELAAPGGDVGVVNLAGRLVDCRPTPRNVEELRRSRVDATTALVAASARLGEPVSRWLQASTTAIWSDAGERRVTESSPLPDDGLPQMTGVARPWEESVRGARARHLVVLRTSIVLDAATPALDRLLLLARLGLGGPVGPGDQWFSWIHVDDWLRVARAALGLEPDVRLPDGPVVAAAPHPVRNRELMAALRRARGRRLGLPTPAPLLRLGAVALRTDPALAHTGRHATSRVLADAGFAFRHPILDDALADLLARP